MRLAAWYCALTGALIFSTSVMAQEPRPASSSIFPGAQGQKQNNLPVQIDAKALEVQDKKKTATFSGNVKVVQGDTTMTCRTLVVFYGQEMGLAGDAPVVKTHSTAGAVPNAQNIRRIEAHGDVLVVSKDQNATGDLGVYDLPAKTITLTGNVVLTQGKNVMHGDRLIVDTVTGNAHVEGAQRAGVRAVIMPDKGRNGADSNTMTIGPGPNASGGPPR